MYNLKHVVESPYDLVVKRKCSSLHQLQYCNVSCVLDYNPLLYKRRWHYYCTSYIITNLLNYVLQCFCFVFVWCPCMAINVSVQHNGGFLPDIILLTQSYYHRDVDTPSREGRSRGLETCDV